MPDNVLETVSVAVMTAAGGIGPLARWRAGSLTERLGLLADCHCTLVVASFAISVLAAVTAEAVGPGKLLRPIGMIAGLGFGHPELLAGLLASVIVGPDSFETWRFGSDVPPDVRLGSERLWREVIFGSTVALYIGALLVLAGRRSRTGKPANCVLPLIAAGITATVCAWMLRASVYAGG